MRAVYGTNNATMEHHLICDGIGAKFSVAGKYIGANAVAQNNSVPVDIVSIVQQSELCELATLCNDNFQKTQMSIHAAQAFINSIAVPCRASFQIKRKVGTEYCTQYIYIYPSNKLNAYK